MIDVFKWDQSFSTQISLIDEQHKGLVKELNKAIHFCLSEKKIGKKDIDELGATLTEYIRNHLITEEKMMNQYKLDERYIKMHKIEHNEFRKRSADFFSSTDSIEKEKVQKFIEYLINWLSFHILSTDKSFGRQISLIKKGITPKEAYEVGEKNPEENLDLLLKALRALFSIVDEKNTKLEKANKNLESKVKERTLELEAANKKLKIMSMNDELTGLPNRRQALIILEQCVKTWKRYGTVFSLLFIDADKFKSVNDTFGHDEGDNVLKWVADFLSISFRASDIVCRLGGDEFLVICAECDVSGSFNNANFFIEKVHKIKNEKPLQSWDISFSVGVAGVSEGTDTALEILKKADDAMYIIKNNGGNGVSKI